MDHRSLEPELARFDPALPIEKAWTPPSSWYTDSAFLERERETVFRRNWLCAGRVDQLPGPGSYLAGDSLGEPHVILRDKAGELRAFHNVCRHHAAAVAEGSGHCEELVCPYHGWAYGLDGRLARAPRVGGIADFDREAIGLAPIAVREIDPLIFLCRAESPSDLDKDLGHLMPLLRTRGLVFQGRRSYRIRCNWKVFVDNYLDGGYHVPVLHAGLAAQLDLDSYETEIFPRFSVQTCAGGGEKAAAEESADFAARIGNRAVYAWLHPNVMLNRYGPILDTNLVVPISARETEVVIDYYFEQRKARDRDFVERAIVASDQVQAEDVAICESVQSGLESPAYECGRYAPKLEMGEHHFHRLLAEDLREENARPA